jgi:K+-sensing histidine kinase KdpD
MGQVIRNAWRLASGLRAELVAITVAPPGGLEALPEERRRSLRRALDLAEDLGAELRVVEGTEVARALATAVKEENVEIRRDENADRGGGPAR